MADIEEFIGALRRVAAGGTVVDPQVVSQLVRRRRDPLSAREREVLPPADDTNRRVLAVLAYLRNGETGR